MVENRERLDLVEMLFHRALDNGLDQIESGWSSDESIRSDVNELLASHRAWSAGPPRSTHPDLPEADAGRSPPPQTTQRRFGPYRAERILGSGGMGTVYLAERSDGQYRQSVAVKVLNASSAGPLFERRFLAERQILAGLNHPSIARLLDGGVTDSGEPYLVLELVEGLPIDQFCNHHRLDSNSRVRLFQSVCDAVDYAHRHLVVHRDLKPSNILVNAEGVPKLVDFGTSRLIEEENTAGLNALTPKYASPEQLRGERVSVATDLFSLGIVLYELLTGAEPFRRGDSIVAVLERAANQLPPAPPASTATAEAARLQGLDLALLRRILSGDLASILFKALAHDPKDRYASVASFSDDLHSWLTRRPVLARPQTRTYRARKFVRRNWIPVTVSLLAIAGLLTATGVAAYQARLAQDRYSDLRGIASSLLTEMREAIRDIPGSTTAQQLMATRVLNNLGKLASASSDPAVQLDLAEAYMQLGELQGSPYAQNLGDPKGGLASLDRGLQILKSPLLAAGSVPYLRLDGLLKRTAGEISFGSGNTAAAVAWLEQSIASFERLARLTREPALLAEVSATHGVLGDVLGQRGTANAGDPDRAFKEYAAAIGLNQEILLANPGFGRSRRSTATMLMKQADITSESNPDLSFKKVQEAAREFSLLPAQEQQRPAMKRFALMLDRKYGNILVELLRFQEAEPVLKRVVRAQEEALAGDPGDQRANFDVAVSLFDLGRLYLESGRNREGGEVFERVVRILDDMCRKDPGNRTYQAHRARQRMQLGRFLSSTGGSPERIAQLGRQAVREATNLAGTPQANLLEFDTLAEILISVVPGSLRDPRAAVALAEKAYHAGHPHELSRLVLLAEANLQAGQRAEARRTAVQALALLSPGVNSALRRRLDGVLKQSPAATPASNSPLHSGSSASNPSDPSPGTASRPLR